MEVKFFDVENAHIQRVFGLCAYVHFEAFGDWIAFLQILQTTISTIDVLLMITGYDVGRYVVKLGLALLKDVCTDSLDGRGEEGIL